MRIYLEPIISACYIFPILSALITLPYIIYQYRKYGSILLLRVLIVYSFVFYMMTSYFMTILPLPPIDSVTPDSATLLLTPFDALRRTYINSGIVINDFSTYINVFKCMDFYQIIFNILLLFPFGVYLRYYFKRNFFEVLMLSFLYSLFFELTQLSGLYGIYPYPYRFFEVDDLICNTLGGITGFIFTPMLVAILPNRERLDEISYKKGTHVSAYRRLFAFLTDFGICTILFCMLKRYCMPLITTRQLERFYYYPLIMVFECIALSIVMYASNGYTLGKAIVKIKITSTNNKKRKPSFFQILCRNILIYLITVPAPYFIYLMLILLNTATTDYFRYTLYFSICIWSIILIIIIINISSRFIHSETRYWYDRILKLKTESTVKSVKKN